MSIIRYHVVITLCVMTGLSAHYRGLFAWRDGKVHDHIPQCMLHHLPTWHQQPCLDFEAALRRSMELHKVFRTTGVRPTGFATKTSLSGPLPPPSWRLWCTGQTLFLYYRVSPDNGSEETMAVFQLLHVTRRRLVAWLYSSLLFLA